MTDTAPIVTELKRICEALDTIAALLAAPAALRGTGLQPAPAANPRPKVGDYVHDIEDTDPGRGNGTVTRVDDTRLWLTWDGPEQTHGGPWPIEDFIVLKPANKDDRQ
jgi:hypothetical protein